MNESVNVTYELEDKEILTEEYENRGISFELSEVSLSYNAINALENIDIKCESGERIGIIGNNGSGKTSLCNLISGLVGPSSGQYYLNGKKASNKGALWCSRRGVRSTNYHPKYYEHLDIYENVIIGSPAFKGDGLLSSFFIPNLFYKERKETAKQILDYCSFVFDKNSKTINSEDKYKVELARALMGNPGLLVLDEPVMGLNEDSKARYAQVILDYCETFSTTLFVVEHDIDFLKSICTRLIAMDASKIIADGDVVSVLRNDIVAQKYLGVKRA
ncbi:MAG: ATP-binding cassette domain-containing protein [Acidimicrobiia bacterium]